MPTKKLKLPVLPSFSTFRDSVWQEYIQAKLAPFEKDVSDYLQFWFLESADGDLAYPNQGLLRTPFDFLDFSKTMMLSPEIMVKTLRVRQYVLEIFNHPQRLAQLRQVQDGKFIPPPIVDSKIMTHAIDEGLALSISDLGVSVVGSDRERVGRGTRLEYGPFVKLGKRARSLLVGSAMPDIYGSVSALSTMAQLHCLVGIPRNSVFHDIKRQVDLVTETMNALRDSEVLVGREDKVWLLNQWKHNLMGVVETEKDKALKRADALYEAGVRVFRVYSPEPGVAVYDTVKELRKKLDGKIEIFAGQVVDVEQAKRLEDAGADGLYVGIGGGGRCITGVRSGSVIDWPQLVWDMRGEISIPVIVEGGASDHIATTLALGASGIGVSRIAGGGTIESPGGMLFCVDNKGEFYKPYGGEASARTKYLDNHMLPFGLPSFVEGETRKAKMSYMEYSLPTLAYNIYSLTEDVILSLVFRAVKEVSDLHAINPSPLRRKTAVGEALQKTH
ncbi:MAG TPA: IMP dehydrogenase [Patescibacteria group bacterium]|nr:IMP dehydrogenase [Patescibacteria group bacterium]